MKFILPFLFASITFLSNAQQRWAKASVNNDTLFGVGIILDNGEWLIEPKYDKIFYWYKHFSVQKNGLYGCVDTTGKMIIDPNYKRVYAYNNYILLKSDDTTYGAAKLNGEILLEPTYKWITNEGKYLIFNDNGNHGMIDTAGNNMLNPVFQEIRIIDDVVFVKKNNLWGALDAKRNYLIQPVYEEFGDKVSCNVLRAKKNGKWGFIDLTGKVVISFQYDEACSFDDNKAHVRIGEKSWFISLKGEKVNESAYLPDCYDDDIPMIMAAPDFGRGQDFGLWQFEENGKYGIKKKDDTLILAAEFDEIGEYHNNAITVRKEGLWGAFSFKGEQIVEIKFQALSRLKTFNSENEYFR